MQCEGSNRRSTSKHARRDTCRLPPSRLPTGTQIQHLSTCLVSHPWNAHLFLKIFILKSQLIFLLSNVAFYFCFKAIWNTPYFDSNCKGMGMIVANTISPLNIVMWSQQLYIHCMQIHAVPEQLNMRFKLGFFFLIEKKNNKPQTATFTQVHWYLHKDEARGQLSYGIKQTCCSWHQLSSWTSGAGSTWAPHRPLSSFRMRAAVWTTPSPSSYCAAKAGVHKHHWCGKSRHSNSPKLGSHISFHSCYMAEMS